MGGRALRQPPRRFAHAGGRRRASGRLRADPPHRRRDWLVRLRLALAAARLSRPARRRRRRAPRPARARGPACRGRARLLARRGLRTRPAAAALGRDEAAGTRLARVRGRAAPRAAPRSGRPRCSTRSGSPVWPIGMPCTLCTSWSSPECSRTSPAQRPANRVPRMALRAVADPVPKCGPGARLRRGWNGERLALMGGDNDGPESSPDKRVASFCATQC